MAEEMAENAVSRTFQKSLVSSVFIPEGQEEVDLNTKDVKKWKDVGEQVAVFFLPNDMQSSLRLRKRTMIGIGSLLILVTVALFGTFFFLSAKCSETLALSFEEQGRNCTKQPFRQSRTLKLDRNGFFMGQLGFTCRHALNTLLLNSYESDDAGFFRDMGVVLSDLRSQALELQGTDYIRGMEELVAMSSTHNNMTAVWNIDPGHLFRTEYDVLSRVYLSSMGMETDYNPTQCKSAYERRLVTAAPIISSTVDQFRSFQLRFSGTESNAIYIPAGETVCTEDFNPAAQRPSSQYGMLVSYFRTKRLADNKDYYTLDFDAAQILAISRCNRQFGNPGFDCTIDSAPWLLKSNQGLEPAFSEQLGKYGYFYETQGIENRRMFVVPELKSHPQCLDCANSLDFEVCQRHIAITAHIHEVDKQSFDYKVSAYFLLYTRGIWNNQYTNLRTHCDVSELMDEVEKRTSASAPFQTEQSIYECTIPVCRSILERIGTAYAASELFAVIVFFIIFAISLVVFAVKQIAVRKRDAFIGALSDMLLERELRSIFNSPIAAVLVGLTLLLGVVACYFCFFFIPPSCQTIETFSSTVPDIQNVQCSSVLLTQNRDLIFDRARQWSTDRFFRASDAFYTLKLRGYTGTSDQFIHDSTTITEQLNTALQRKENLANDAIRKHESLIFLQGKLPGMELEFFRQPRAVAAIERPYSTQLTIRSRESDECTVKLDSVHDYSELGILSRASPIIGFTFPKPDTYFQIDRRENEFRTEENGSSDCFKNLQQWRTAHEKLVSDFQHVINVTGTPRLALFMDDLLMLDTCSRNATRSSCEMNFSMRRKDVEYDLQLERYAMRWPTSLGESIVVVPEFETMCESTCTGDVMYMCDRQELTLKWKRLNDPEIIVETTLAFRSEFPLNDFGATPLEQCTLTDVRVQDANVTVPIETSFRLNQCTYDVCTTVLSRIASAFADTDFISELTEIAAVLAVFMLGFIRRDVLGWALKPLSNRARKVMSRSVAYATTAFVLAAAVGMLAGFFVLFGACQESTMLSTTPKSDGSCEQIMIQQDGQYILDTDSRWSTQDGHNPRKALFRISFSDYDNNEKDHRENLRVLLRTARSLVENMRGKDFLTALQIHDFAQVTAGGSRGKTKFELNRNLDFFGRWINSEPSAAIKSGEAYTLDEFWCNCENIDDIPERLETCDLPDLYRAHTIGVENDNLLKFFRFTKTASSIERKTCKNLDDNVVDFMGRNVLASYSAPGSRETYGDEEYMMTMDWSQVLGLDYCNKNITSCSYLWQRQDFDEHGRREVAIPNSWEANPSIYDPRSKKYGFLWVTGVSKLAEQTYAQSTYFVVPRLLVPEECKVCDGQPSNCGLLAVAVLDCYDINGGGPGIIEYVTSFGKRMDLHGLWNAQGVASNLHCEPTEILDFLEEERIEDFAANSISPFESTVDLFFCTVDYCPQFTDRFGDAFAVTKLFTIIFLFFVTLVCLVIELFQFKTHGIAGSKHSDVTSSNSFSEPSSNQPITSIESSDPKASI